MICSAASAPVGCQADRVTLLGQEVLEQLADIGVIVDDKHGSLSLGQLNSALQWWVRSSTRRDEQPREYGTCPDSVQHCDG